MNLLYNLRDSVIYYLIKFIRALWRHNDKFKMFLIKKGGNYGLQTNQNQETK